MRAALAPWSSLSWGRPGPPRQLLEQLGNLYREFAGVVTLANPVHRSPNPFVLAVDLEDGAVGDLTRGRDVVLLHPTQKLGRQLCSAGSGVLRSRPSRCPAPARQTFIEADDVARQFALGVILAGPRNSTSDEDGRPVVTGKAGAVGHLSCIGDAVLAHPRANLLHSLPVGGLTVGASRPARCGGVRCHALTLVEPPITWRISRLVVGKKLPQHVAVNVELHLGFGETAESLPQSAMAADGIAIEH